MNRALPPQQFQLFKNITRWLDDQDSTSLRLEKMKKKNEKLRLDIDKQLLQFNQLNRMSKYVANWRQQNKMPEIKKSNNASANALLSQLSESINKQLNQHETTQTKLYCDMRQHVHQYLDADLTAQKQNLHQLTTKKDRLLTKIAKLLSSDHPYHHQKFLQTIKNQMKSQGDREAFTIVRKIMSRMLSKPANQGNASNRLMALLSQNISLLKQIKERKIINNDMIYECSEQLQRMENMKNSGQHINKMKKNIENIEQRYQISIIQRPVSIESHAQQLLSELDHKIHKKLTQMKRLLKMEKYSTHINREDLQAEAHRIEHRLTFIS